MSINALSLNMKVTGKETELKRVVSSCSHSAEAVEDGQRRTPRGESWQPRLKLRHSLQVVCTPLDKGPVMHIYKSRQGDQSPLSD